MSIQLDLALFLRENFLLDKKGNTIPVSATVRGFLFTLTFRVGSNPYAWVSQEQLANELDLSIDGLKKLSAKALATGLIETMPCSRDKRKRLYRPADFLINYHQKRRNKIEQDPLYGVRFTKKMETLDEEYVPKRAPTLQEYVPKRAPTRCLNGHLFSENKSENTNTNNDIDVIDPSLKEHKRKIKAKEKEARAHFLPDNFTASPKNIELANRSGINLSKEIEKMRNWSKAKGKKMFDWQATLNNWLLREIDNSPNQIKPMTKQVFENKTQFRPQETPRPSLPNWTDERIERELQGTVANNEGINYGENIIRKGCAGNN